MAMASVMLHRVLGMCTNHSLLDIVVAGIEGKVPDIPYNQANEDILSYSPALHSMTETCHRL